MSDSIRRLSEMLSRDQGSLVFVELGEELRRSGKIEAARTVAETGLARHPNLPDAHDLYARVLADLGHVERAKDEWDITVALDARHIGAHKGLAYIYYQGGEYDRALEHLESALAVDPSDRSIAQALYMVRQAQSSDHQRQARLVDGSDVFIGLDEHKGGVLLVDLRGRMLGGYMEDEKGGDISEEVGAYLAGASQEAQRTARFLDIGEWEWMMAETSGGNIHLSQPTSQTILFLVRETTVPSGRLAVLAERAGKAALQWLEAQRP